MCINFVLVPMIRAFVHDLFVFWWWWHFRSCFFGSFDGRRFAVRFVSNSWVVTASFFLFVGLPTIGELGEGSYGPAEQQNPAVSRVRRPRKATISAQVHLREGTADGPERVSYEGLEGREGGGEGASERARRGEGRREGGRKGERERGGGGRF